MQRPTTIHLRDALRLMGEKDPSTGQPVPFSYVRYTHNRKTRRGGKRVEVPEAVLLTEAARANPRSIRARKEAKLQNEQDPKAKLKTGAHFRHGTRDMLLPDGSKDRVIICLITEFNDMRVVL